MCLQHWRKEKDLKLQQEADRQVDASLEGSLPPNMGGWGWAWLERWMIARPWEHRLMMAHYQTILAAHSLAHQNDEETAVQQGGSTKSQGAKDAIAGPNLSVIGSVAHRYREVGTNFELVTVGNCKSCGRRIRVKTSVAAAAAAAADALEKAEEAAAIADEWKRRLEEEGELSTEETQAAADAADAAAVASEQAAQAAAFPPLAHLDMCNICLPTVSWAAKLGALPPAETLAENGTGVNLLNSLNVLGTPAAAPVARVSSVATSTATSTYGNRRGSAPPRWAPPSRASSIYYQEQDAIDEVEEEPEPDYSHLPRFMQPTTARRHKLRNSPGAARRLSGGAVEPVALADASRSFAESLRSDDRRAYEERVVEQRAGNRLHQQQRSYQQQPVQVEEEQYEEEQTYEEEHAYEEEQAYEEEAGHEEEHQQYEEEPVEYEQHEGEEHQEEAHEDNKEGYEYEEHSYNGHEHY